MTVRDATQRESPDGNVLYIEDLREHLGLKTTTDTASSPLRETKSCPEVIPVGHDMHGDFKSLENEGIDLTEHLHYSGCVDTHVVVEDAGATMSKSLSKLMYHYDLADLEYKRPACSKVKGKWHFVGAHNVGNDAIATLKVILAQALDRRLSSSSYQYYSTRTSDEETIYYSLLDEPPRQINTNMILLAYDHEGVETPRYKPTIRNRTSEHGFAWFHLKDVASIPPGKNGVNWHPFIRARHWINRAFRNFESRWFCPGNLDGFWREFGVSEYYGGRDSPGAFHELFQDLATGARGEVWENGVDGVTTLLGKRRLGRCGRGLARSIPKTWIKTLG